MEYYLTSRSLTYAQRSSKVLDMAGIRNTVTRTPNGMSPEGCGYAVKVRSVNLKTAVDRLRRANLSPRRVFGIREDGSAEEVKI